MGFLLLLSKGSAHVLIDFHLVNKVGNIVQGLDETVFISSEKDR